MQVKIIIIIIKTLTCQSLQLHEVEKSCSVQLTTNANELIKAFFGQKWWATYIKQQLEFALLQTVCLCSSRKDPIFLAKSCIPFIIVKSFCNLSVIFTLISLEIFPRKIL